MTDLRDVAFADLPAQRETKRNESFSDKTGGSGNDIHGTRSEGELPGDFVKSSAPLSLADTMQQVARGGITLDPRAAARAGQRQQLVAVRDYLVAQQKAGGGTQAADAIAAVKAALAA